MTQKYQVGDEFTITEVPFDKEQDIEHSYPAKLVSIEKGVYKLEAHNNCCFYMDERLKPIDRVDAYGRVDSLTGFLCSFVSHIEITPKPEDETKKILDAVAQGVGELGLDMHVVQPCFDTKNWRARCEKKIGFTPISLECSEGKYQEITQPVADATRYGVLTERTYRPRGTIRAVKADPKKFEMIRSWSGDKISQFDSVDERDRMKSIIGWEIDTHGAGLIGGNGSDINRELIFFGKYDPKWYICKDEAGHVWPVRDDVFPRLYEEVL